jgi:hypothetical protein
LAHWQKTSPKSPRISLRACGRKRRLWGLFSAPLPSHPNPLSGRFNHFLGSSAPSAQRASRRTVAHVFDINSHSPSPFLRGTYFGSSSSVPKMDSSPSTLHIMARGIYRTVLPTGFRPRLPVHRRSLSSGVYSLFSRTHASSHERTTTTAPPCPSSSTLDLTRVP